MKKIFLNFFFLAVVAIPVQSQINQSEFLIQIETKKVSEIYFTDTLDIYLTTRDVGIGGFSLKLGFNPRQLAIVDVLRSDILDSCNWEFFNARQMKSSINPENTLALWQIVGMAEMAGDTVGPKCFGYENSRGSLIKVIISNEHLMPASDSLIPLYFLWENCADNTLSSIKGNQLLLSSSVVNYPIVEQGSIIKTFPTIDGAPEECIKKGTKNKPNRAIEFHNGGIIYSPQADIDSL